MKTTNTLKFTLIVISMMAAIISNANDFNLPDLGTPSDSSLSPIKEKEIREKINENNEDRRRKKKEHFCPF